MHVGVCEGIVGRFLTGFAAVSVVRLVGIKTWRFFPAEEAELNLAHVLIHKMFDTIGHSQ